MVESKSGKTYPVKTEYDSMGESLYNQLVNRAHDNKVYWGWVSFEDEHPVLKDWIRSGSDSDPPEDPPWDR